jgi:hypothetical protein
VLSNPGEQFSITDSTDYDALTSCIAVLGVALSGIENYVAEESTLRKMTHISDGSPRRKEPMPLEQIRARLDAIHGKICMSALPMPPFPWLIGPMWVCPQLTRVPPISIDLEQRVLYNAFRCAYIINVLPSPRREGNYVWATFSALARTLDSRSVEIGRSFILSIIFYLVLLVQPYSPNASVAHRSWHNLSGSYNITSHSLCPS